MLKEQLFHSLLNKEVYATGQVKSFPAGTVIINLHAYIKTIPIVLSGSLRVIKTDEEGREILLYYIKPGESCIMSILAGMHHDQSKIKAIVEADAEILLIPVEKGAKWIKEFPEWTDFIFTLYQKRFEELRGIENAIVFQKLDTHLLYRLKQKAALFQSPVVTVIQQQLADEPGTSREATSRV